MVSVVRITITNRSGLLYNVVMKSWWLSLIFAVLSTVFVLDLLLHQGRPATYDGPTHLTTFVEVARGLQVSQFPVVWADDFAKFGLPIPLLAQQTTSYLGAILWLVTNNLSLSYAGVVWIGAFFSLWLAYLVLSKWVNPVAALSGALLLHLAPYRISNVYARGALPEFFFTSFLLLSVLGMWEYFRQRKWSGWWMVMFGLAGMVLTHPMMIVPASVVLAPFGLWCLVTTHREYWQTVKLIVVLAMAGVAALGVSAYYLLPLLFEIKYFYYGLSSSHLYTDHFLSVGTYITDQWLFFDPTSMNPRQVYLGLGHVENVIAVMALVVLVFFRKVLQVYQKPLLAGGILVLAASIFMTLPVALPIYSLPLLEGIQHPWRFLTVMIVLPPLFVSIILDVLPARLSLLLSTLFIALLLFIRIPQLYGKNYLLVADQSYDQMYRNVHGTYLNTIWSGEIESYPPKKDQIVIIEGQGMINNLEVNNGFRSFIIDAQSEVRILDNTFYFPGWRVISNDEEVPIEFQDPNYRGLITFKLSPGTHTVTSQLRDTKIRMLGKVGTLLSLLGLASIWGYFSLIQKKVTSNERALRGTS